jgi:phosphohistidine phosphatase
LEPVTVKVYIVRHGKAEHGEGYVRDEDRPLTPRGMQQAKFLGDRIAEMDSPPKLILTSGLTRAIETARIIHAVIRCRLEQAPALETGHDAGEVVDLISRHKNGSLMIVGHNPQLGELAAILTAGAHADETGETMLKTGTALVVEVRQTEMVGSGRIVARVRLDEACADLRRD